MTTYSAFFASGLLAPHTSAGHQHQHVLQHQYNTSTTHTNYSDHHSDPESYGYLHFAAPPSPVSRASHLQIAHADDSDVEVDIDGDVDMDTDRDCTPTPDVPRSRPNTTNSNSNPNHATDSTSTTNTNVTTTTGQPRPRLRKRRSSLTVGTSPMNAIRSPARTAGAALQLQMHLPSPPRSRSGSLSAAPTILTPTIQPHPNAQDLYSALGHGNVASEGTSLVGRMRSGSVGGALRPRRGVRRLASVPAPAPPPTAPLPAIPALMLPPKDAYGPYSAPLGGSFPGSRTPPGFGCQAQVQGGGGAGAGRAPLVSRPVDVQGPAAIGRERSFSLGRRIEEEMKEN